MNKKRFLILISVFFISYLFFSTISAQEDSTTTDLSIEQTILESSVNSDIENIVDNAIISDESINTELEDLDGTIIEEPKNIPSGFGLMWQNFKQDLSLTFTFDKVKKAEKRLQYAEEKIKIANFIAEASDDPKVQEKAQKMIETANKHIAKIEENKDKLFDNIDDKKSRLLKNLATHQLNTEKVLEKLEDKIPVEKLEQFQIFRDKLAEKKDTFLEKIQDNANIPEDVKQKILDTKDTIEEKRIEREQTRLETKDLIQEIKSGNEEAKVELEQLRLQIKEEKQQRIEGLKLKKDQIIQDIKSGDESLKRQAIDAINKLNIENKIQNTKRIMEKKQIKADVKELKNDLKQEAKQIIRETQQIKKTNGNATGQ